MYSPWVGGRCATDVGDGVKGVTQAQLDALEVNEGANVPRWITTVQPQLKEGGAKRPAIASPVQNAPTKLDTAPTFVT
jgi:hypothetical protein